jgi:pimeloyl-ACP methyl ester carboxylesterase
MLPYISYYICRSLYMNLFKESCKNNFFSFVFLLFLWLALLPNPTFANIISSQTQEYNQLLNVWQTLQELGDNLTGPLGSVTFRIFTDSPHDVQLNLTAENIKIYDKTTNEEVARGCLSPGNNDPLSGLFFNTQGVPDGYEDVLVDFSCRNFSFILGHRYLLWISNATLPPAGPFGPGVMHLAASNYITTPNDFFAGGGLRYAYYYTSCNPLDYVWNSFSDSAGCNVYATQRDDLYFILSDQPPIPPQPTKTPLILIPGIGGSEFKTAEEINWSAPDGHGGIFNHIYPEGERVWVNQGEAVKPGNDDYFDILRLKPDGITVEANLELTGNLFDSYQDTINFFISNGYKLNETLFTFPYDWRKDLALTTPLLNQKVQEIKQQTNAQKVDIVAHSMGGLVARNYIADSNKAQNIRKLIELGIPHLGSPDLLSKLHYGGCLKYPFGPFCLSLAPTELKDVIQNMTGGFQLSPTQTYFDFYNNSDLQHPYPFKDDRDMDANGVTGPLNYPQIKFLLTNLGYNTSLFIPAETFHNIDNNYANTNGVDVTIIAGSGIATLGQIIEKNVPIFLGIKIPKKDTIMINGDNTVPLFSASLHDPSQKLSLLGNAKLFYTKQNHGALVQTGPALDLVKNILNDDSSIPTNISTQLIPLKGKLISVHSPINLLIFDSLNNQTGITNNGEIINNIPGSEIEILDDTKFIWLPENGQYNITLKSTGYGIFDFKIRDFNNDINIGTTLYKDIPINPSSKAQLIFESDSSISPVMQIDQNGDGSFEKSITPTGQVSGNEYQDTQAPEIQASFNLQTKKLAITGVDESTLQEFNPQTGVKIFKDLADNSTKVEFNQITKNLVESLSLKQIQYNNDPNTTFSDNQFIVVYTSKSGRTIVVNQDIIIKGEKIISTIYNPLNNKTTIFKKDKDGKIITETKFGMSLLKLSTQNGQLIITY